ncbi:MAG TPA: ABC transporter substrate-binding protein [Nitrolancea sp.]|nr:ABC transporter substrate-binding protein [Nitrolancea sp.]
MPDFHDYLVDSGLDRRNFVKRAAALALAVPAVGSLLAACGSSSSKSTATTAAAAAATSTPTPQITINQNASPVATTAAAAGTSTTAAVAGKKGGKVTFLRTDEADIYDPVLNDANTVIWIIGNVYETLVKPNKDSNGIEPGLAEKYNVSSDGLTVTFNLRAAKFSDGSDLTPDDVIFSLTRARDTDVSPWTFTMTEVKNITAPDASTVVVTLAQPWAPFLAGVAMFNGGIVSKAFFDKNAQETNNTGTGKSAKGIGLPGMQSMGTGPYVITNWQLDQQTVLSRNDHYWDSTLPYLDEIKILQVPDANSEILQMQSGSVDGLIGQSSVPFNRVAELQKDPKLQVLILPASYAGNIQFNIEKPPLNDIHFRRALNYATDVKTLISTVVYGLGKPSNSFMPIGSLYWNPDQEPYPFDLDMAKSELAMSATPTGGKVEVLTPPGNAQTETEATTLKDMWSKIGVDLTITPTDPQVSRARILAHNFQMRIAAWTNDMIDPDEIVGYYITPENSENARSGWTNQQAIDLAHAAQAEQDPDKRRQDYYDIQKIYKETGPMIFTFDIPYVVVLSTKVKNYGQTPLGAYLFATMSLES